VRQDGVGHGAGHGQRVGEVLGRPLGDVEGRGIVTELARTGLGQGAQLLAGSGVDGAAAGDDEGALGGLDEGDGALQGGDRKSGSAGTPRPISYADFCLQKHNTHNINNKEGNSLCQQLLP